MMSIKMMASANMWYQSAQLENEELVSKLHDPGKIRMKKMENKHGKRRETNSDSDYMSPQLRAIAILKQEIAIMELQYEIALMEYESGRHEDNGDAGEVMTRGEEDDSKRDVLTCKDVQKLNGKMQEDRDGYYNREDDKDTESREKSVINRKHHKRKHRDDKDDKYDKYRKDKYSENGNKETKYKDDKYIEIGDIDERSRDRKRMQDDDRDYHEEEEEEEESAGYNRNRSLETASSDVKMKKRRTQEWRE
ncbi:hypothetical protein Hanom_Chr16g01499471 [Helianthus anomalus]